MTKELKDAEMYGIICKDRFDKLEALHKETLDLLRGKDGDPGVLDDMRAMKRGYRIVGSGVLFVIGAVVIQAVASLWGWLTKIL
jgi:hypothetical protein